MYSYAYFSVSQDEQYTTIIHHGKSINIPTDVLEDIIHISSEEASIIAELFLSDMISTSTTSWNNSTKIKRIVSMYNESASTEVTAYSIELTQGYIIVSAYADAQSLIPEWSDVAEPTYSSFDNSNKHKVIYLGFNNYYLDVNSTYVKDLFGVTIPKDSLINSIELTRDINNIPLKAIQSSFDNYSVNSRSIDDPFFDAYAVYNELFECVEYANYWELYLEKDSYGNYSLYTGQESQGYGWYRSCGPVAIANILMTYKNKYPNNNYIPENRENLIDVICNHGITHSSWGIQWYTNSNDPYQGGTSQHTEHHYILSCLTNEFAVPCNVLAYNTTYSTIKECLDNGYLVYINVYSHSYYGTHAMMCYAYTRLQGTETGYYKTYLKVADGFNSEPRYVDFATCVYDSTLDRGDFSMVELWQ